MKKKQFLHLDDSYIALMIFKKTFEKYADICNVQTIEDAKKILSDLPDIDCFILDYNLWGGNSLSFIKEIRQMDKYIYVPIILLTSTITSTISYNAMKAGVNVSCSKMMQPVELKKTLFEQLKAPYVVLISQEHVDLSCTTWSCNNVFYQYNHSFMELISAESSEKAEQKMKDFLNDQVNVKKNVANDINILSFQSHRIILDKI